MKTKKADPMLATMALTPVDPWRAAFGDLGVRLVLVRREGSRLEEWVALPTGRGR